MDVNGVPVHLVLTPEEWRIEVSDDITWTDQGGGATCVGRWPSSIDPHATPVPAVRHAAVDEVGRVLWIDPDRDVLVRTVVFAERHEILLPTGAWRNPARLDEIPCDRDPRIGLAGVAVRGDTVAVGRAATADVALLSGAAPWRVLDLPTDGDLAITDLAWGHDDDLHVLLTSANAAEIATLDVGTSVQRSRSVVQLGEGEQVHAVLRGQTSLLLVGDGPDGPLLVLDPGSRHPRRLTLSGVSGSPRDLGRVVHARLGDVGRGDQLWLATTAHEDLLTFSLPGSTVLAGWIGARPARFSASAIGPVGGVAMAGSRALVMGAAPQDRGRWYLLDDAVGDDPIGQAATVVGPFDSEVDRCVWHRVVIDALMPPGAAVGIASLTVDGPLDPSSEPPVSDDPAWRVEPPPSRGPSELPFHDPVGQPADRQSLHVLLQEAVGRHLWLRVTLDAPSGHAPVLTALRVYGPRFSYGEHYLPNVLVGGKVDPGSFIERFLGLVEGIYSSIEARVEAAQGLLDPRQLDAEYLRWLGAWVGVVIDDDWEPWRVRLLIQRAAQLYSQRGTVRGILNSLAVAVSDCPDEAWDNMGKPQFGYRIVELVSELPDGETGNWTIDVPDPAAGPLLVDPASPWNPAEGVEGLLNRLEQTIDQPDDDQASTDPQTMTIRSALTRLPDPLAGPRPSGFNPPATTPSFPDRIEQIGGLPLWTEASATGDPSATPPVADIIAELAQQILPLTGAPVAPHATELFRPPAVNALTYSDFLLARYPVTAQFSKAYPQSADVNEMELSTTLEHGGTALQDQLTYLTKVMPHEERAHRFVVEVPYDPERPADESSWLLARVRRVVETVRPAHTIHHVRWRGQGFAIGQDALDANHLGPPAQAVSRRPVLLGGGAGLGEGRLTGPELITGKECEE